MAKCVVEVEGSDCAPCDVGVERCEVGRLTRTGTNGDTVRFGESAASISNCNPEGC